MCNLRYFHKIIFFKEPNTNILLSGINVDFVRIKNIGNYATDKYIHATV